VAVATELVVMKMSDYRADPERFLETLSRLAGRIEEEGSSILAGDMACFLPGPLFRQLQTSFQPIAEQTAARVRAFIRDVEKEIRPGRSSSG